MLGWRMLCTRGVVSSGLTTTALSVLATTATTAAGAPLFGPVAAKLLDQAIGVGTNLLSSALESAVDRDPLPGFNHDFRKALALSLLECLRWGTSSRGPLQRRLLDRGNLDANFLEKLLAAWREHIQSALDELPDARALEALFPPLSKDGELVQLTGNADSSETELWRAFYDQSLSAPLRDSLIVQVLGGDDYVRDAIIPPLAEAFPEQLSEVLKQDRFKRSWVAFQKICFERIRSQLSLIRDEQSALGSSLTRVERQIDSILANEAQFGAFVDSQLDAMKHLQVLSDGLRWDVADMRAVQMKHGDVLASLDAAARRATDPPLRMPYASSRLQDGMAALHFSERPIRDLLGRGEELRLLGEFAEAPEKFVWWAVVGDAGIGKSRLAFEFADRLTAEGWHCGFLVKTSSWLSNEGSLRAWTPEVDTLIVIDDARSRGAQLVASLATLWHERSRYRHRVRVILTNRPGTWGHRFRSLHWRTYGDEANDKAVRDCLFQPGRTSHESSTSEGADAEFLQLGALPRHLWRTFFHATSERLDNASLPLPDSDEAPFWSAVARMSSDGNPLLLQLIAMTQSPQRLIERDKVSRDDLLREIVVRERAEMWRIAVGVEDQASWEFNLRPRFESAIGLVTLTRGLSLSASGAKAALATAAGIAGVGGDFRYLCFGLEAILGLEQGGGVGARLRPLEPNLLAAYLLVSGIEPDERGDAYLDAEGIVDLAVAQDPFAVAETVALASASYPVRTLPWLLALLDRLPTSACAAESDEAAESSLFPAIAAAVVNALTHGVEFVQSGLSKRLDKVARSSEGNRYGLLTYLQMLQGLALGSRRLAVLDEQLLAPTDPKVVSVAFAELVAGCLADAIRCYAQAGAWRDVERFGMRLRELAAEYPASIQVQRWLAAGSVNAMWSRRGAEGLIALERWGETLEAVTDRWPDHSFQSVLAKGASNAIIAYCRTEDFDALRRWIGVLTRVTDRRPDDLETRQLLSEGLFDAIACSGKAAMPGGVELWGAQLYHLSIRHADDAQIRNHLVTSAIHAIRFYYHHKVFDRMEEWGRRLTSVRDGGADDFGLERMKAEGAALLVSAHNAGGMEAAMVRWLAVLERTTSDLVREPPPSLNYARAMVSAVSGFLAANDREGARRWGASLVEFIETSETAVSWLHHQFAEIAVAAVIANQETGPFADLEWWASRLVQVAGKSAEDSDVLVLLSRGVSEVMKRYAEVSDLSALRRWAEFIEFLALATEFGGESDEVRIQLLSAFSLASDTFELAGSADAGHWKGLRAAVIARWPGPDVA